MLKPTLKRCGIVKEGLKVNIIRRIMSKG